MSCTQPLILHRDGHATCARPGCLGGLDPDEARGRHDRVVSCEVVFGTRCPLCRPLAGRDVSPGTPPASGAGVERVGGVDGSSAPVGPTIDVLMVEDEPSVSSTTQEILDAAGLRVTIANTVDDALVVIAGGGVGVVILDHQIAGEDGERFLTQAVGPLPPVIVMSGLGTYVLDRFRAAHAAQIFACLSKPVSPPELIATVRAASAAR